MKIHPQANALASRLSQAANTPVTRVPFTAPQPDEPEATPQPETDSQATPAAAVETGKPRRKRKRQAESDEADDTVPISLRPRRTTLSKYVNAAADRSREIGRTISAQQIMLEVLERGP